MKKEIYKKHNSFSSFKGKNTNILESAITRILRVRDSELGLISLSSSQKELLDEAIKDLSNRSEKINEIFKHC